MSFADLLEALCLPPGLSLLLGLAGGSLLARRPRTGRGLLLLAFLSLYLASIPPLPNLLLSSLEDHPPLSPEQLAASQARAIVILGAGQELMELGEMGTRVTRQAVERLHQGALLARQTGLPMLVTGGRPRGEALSEAQLMANLLEAWGLSPRWREEESRDTWENAAHARKILAREGIGEVLLVTHGWHMNRALLSFARHGLTAVPAPVPPVGKPFSWEQLLPSPGPLNTLRLVWHEYLGYAWYALTKAEAPP